MYDTILAPLDGTLVAERELEHALRLLNPGGTLHLLAVDSTNLLVCLPPPALAQQTVEKERDERRRYLESRGKSLEAQREGIHVVTHLKAGRPETTIVDTAEEVEADLVVMSLREKSVLERLLFGSTTEHVVRHLQAPVLVVHAEDRETADVS